MDWDEEEELKFKIKTQNEIADSYQSDHKKLSSDWFSRFISKKEIKELIELEQTARQKSQELTEKLNKIRANR
jgi:hypothetical protein